MSQLFKNTASQKIRVRAFADAGHATLDAGEPVTGDAANISAQTALDNAALGASNDAAPDEVDPTNAPGIYEFDPTQTETNGDVIEWYPKSSTAGVQVVTVGGDVQVLLPPNLPALGIETDGDLTKVNTLNGHTAQTADHTTGIADIPTVAEFNARTLAAADYFDPAADTVANVTTVATLSGHTAQTADHTASIAAIPTNAELYEALDTIYVDAAGSSGTTAGVNGIPSNPCPLADAITISTATGAKRLILRSNITLAATMSGYHFSSEGPSYQVTGGSQEVGGSTFEHLSLTGTFTASTQAHAHQCRINTSTLPAGMEFDQCEFQGATITLGTSTYIMRGCHFGVTTLDFGAAVLATGVRCYNCSGNLTIWNMNQAGSDSLELHGRGDVTLNANCVGGTAKLYGDWILTDNSATVSVTKGGTGLSEAGGTGDHLTALPLNDPTAAAIVAALLAQDASAYTTASTLGAIINDWTDGGRLDLLLDRLITELDTARAEPSQGAPAASAKIGAKIDYLYKSWRNKTTTTATTYSLFNDDTTTVDHKATLTDDGTTATKNEMATGP